MAATVTDADLELAFNAHFLLTGCVQYASDQTTWQTNLSPAACTALTDCNWAPGRDNTTCLNAGGLNQTNMCAVCDSNNRCTEVRLVVLQRNQVNEIDRSMERSSSAQVSVFAACRSPYQSDRSVPIDIACTSSGTLFSSPFTFLQYRPCDLSLVAYSPGNYWDAYLGSCLLVGSTTRAACLPSQWHAAFALQA
jgi:hypothetical protein